MADFATRYWIPSWFELSTDDDTDVDFWPFVPSVNTESCCIDLDPTLLHEHVALPDAARALVSRDLANPFMPRDAPSANAPLGTFQIDGTGDLANDEGRVNLRKRIFRRATSLQGSFFHLAGYGFAQGLKTLIRPDDLRRLQSRARAQVLQEPDVQSASVTARAISQNPAIVRLDIKARDIYGVEVDVTADLRFRA